MPSKNAFITLEVTFGHCLIYVLELLQPLFKAKHKAHADAADVPVLPHCPVLMPRGQNHSVRSPVAVGDTGLAVFVDRTMDNFMSGDYSSIEPQADRTHNMTDAVFMPGFVPTGQQTQDTAADFVLNNRNSRVRLRPDGRVVLKINQAHELADLFQQLTDLTATLHQTLQTP